MADPSVPSGACALESHQALWNAHRRTRKRQLQTGYRRMIRNQKESLARDGVIRNEAWYSETAARRDAEAAAEVQGGRGEGAFPHSFRGTPLTFSCPDEDEEQGAQISSFAGLGAGH